MSLKNILVCEDEDAIRDFVVLNLKRAGYEVTDVSCGEDAVKEFELSGGRFSVALLDIMMPGMSGIEVCKAIREKDSKIGIIMLTAKSQEIDKVQGLSSGADDYITKPFSPLELVARVDAVIRRISASEQSNVKSTVTSGPFTLDTQSRTVKKNGEPLELTQIEYGLMEYFITNEGVALDRNSILKKVWQEEFNIDYKIVDVNIRRLRMKIEDDPSSPSFIQTVWGFGYRWVV